MMRGRFLIKARVLGFMLLLFFPQQKGQVSAESLPVIAMTEPMLSVECERGLSFGTLHVVRENSAGSISVPANSNAQGSVNGSGIMVRGDVHSARCVVTNVTTNQNAVLSLSAADGSTGAFLGGVLEGVYITNGAQRMPIKLELNRTTIESADVSDLIEVFIGGELFIAANEQGRGTFSGVFTLTVTD